MQPRLRIAALFLVLAGTALSAGQNTPPPDIQTPTFRAEVEYVEVDAVVTDAEGNFVRDLKKEDFQVLEDGKAQNITAFSLVDIPVDKPDQPLFAAGPIEPDVRSNERPFDGRVYVLILDDLHTAALRSQRVKAAARQFIQRNLGANDLMAIVQTGGRTDAAQEFTGNRRLLLAAVDKFMGRKLDSVTIARNDAFYRQGGLGGAVLDPDEMERAHNAQSTLRSVREVAEWFGGVRGRRKTILFVSEGIDYDIYNVIADYNAPANRASAILDDMRATISATGRSNVSIYAIDPRGLTDLSDESIAVSSFAGSDPAITNADGTRAARPDIGLRSLMNDLRLSQDSLRALAEETGGFAAVNTNEFSNAFERVVRDNSSYYVLAYYPPSTKRDGKFHRIQVRTTRQGLTVRARRGYASPKGKAPAPAAKPTTSGPSPKLVDALKSPMQVSGLTMRVFAAAFKGTAPNASVLLAVEMHGRDLELAENSKLEISYVAVDTKGKSQGAKTDRVTLNLKPDTRARIQETGLRTLTRLELPPGRYQLRVGAYDTSGGAVGSVIQDLEVPEFTKLPFSMSGLVITSPSGAETMTVRADELLKDILPGPPSALRTFTKSDEIVLFAEVYDNAGGTPHKVDIVTTLTSDTGTVVAKLVEERESSELQGKSGGYGYLARLPLDEVPPGTYVLATEAKSRLGQQTVARQVMVRVAAPPPQSPR